ncbi:hypothetical protein Tco_1017689 [Tanacetum coccineum]|uniref:Uncharacterized protein n=1 Tax=Tanacetum coccineum TaxID=301880 RepID=A0ABQ5FSN2_9ASTR
MNHVMMKYFDDFECRTFQVLGSKFRDSSLFTEPVHKFPISPVLIIVASSPVEAHISTSDRVPSCFVWQDISDDGIVQSTCRRGNGPDLHEKVFPPSLSQVDCMNIIHVRPHHTRECLNICNGFLIHKEIVRNPCDERLSPGSQSLSTQSMQLMQLSLRHFWGSVLLTDLPDDGMRLEERDGGAWQNQNLPVVP